MSTIPQRIASAFAVLCGQYGDLTQMAAQIPALFETLSGMPMSDLLSKVRKIGDKAPRPDESAGV